MPMRATLHCIRDLPRLHEGARAWSSSPEEEHGRMADAGAAESSWRSRGAHHDGKAECKVVSACIGGYSRAGGLEGPSADTYVNSRTLGTACSLFSNSLGVLQPCWGAD